MISKAKIAAKWRTLSQTQKALLYIYLGHCRDIPSSPLNFEARKENFGDLLSGCHDFVLEVEKCGYASCRKEVREILEGIGETGLLYYPKLQTNKRKRALKAAVD